MTTPMAVLMGTILTIGTLSRNSEITAIRSSGVSLLQLGRPLLMTAAAISMLLLFLQEFVNPTTNAKMNSIDQVFVKKQGQKASFRQNNIWHRDEKTILQAKLFTPEKNSLSGITIWELGPQLQPLTRIDADTGTPDKNGWQLANVFTREFGPDGAISMQRDATVFKKIDLVPADLKKVAQDAEDMGFTALWRYCRAISENGYDATRYLTMLHAKISLPFAALIMAFLGIPFSLRDGRKGGIGIGIGVSVAIGFTYFIINALLLSLGQAGALPPAVAAWAANLIFAGAGLWFTLKVDD
jgi:lipopolysaccharide export system permease protein